MTALLLEAFNKRQSSQGLQSRIGDGRSLEENVFQAFQLLQRFQAFIRDIRPGELHGQQVFQLFEQGQRFRPYGQAPEVNHLDRAAG